VRHTRRRAAPTIFALNWLDQPRNWNNAMPFVPVANTVLAELRMTADNQFVENTLYFEYLTLPTLTEMQTLGQALIDWWDANIAPLVWIGVELREVVVTALNSGTGLQATVVPAVTQLGELNVSALPMNVSLTISFRTGLRGRSFRGRNYIVGLVEGQTTSANEVVSATSAAFVDAYNLLLDFGQDIGASWVVVSRFSGVDSNGDPIPRAAGVTTPITSVLVVDNIVDSQRRRLPGRGR
jgi:hypothetical protein